MSRSQSTARVYVGNLPYDVSEREVEDLFYKFGHIRDIEVKRSRNHDGAYAFVLYDDRRAVEEAIDRRDGIRFGRGYLRVERGGERRGGNRRDGDREGYGPPRRSSYRVRVTGLPATCSWQDLKDHMRKAGDVGYANVENGVGIVEYAHRDDMEHAVRTLDRSVFANIFHKTEIRVEPDDMGDVEGYYRRKDNGKRRSRSRGRSSRGSDRGNSRGRSLSNPPRGDSVDQRSPSPSRGGNSVERQNRTNKRHSRSSSRGGSPRRESSMNNRDERNGVSQSPPRRNRSGSVGSDRQKSASPR